MATRRRLKSFSRQLASVTGGLAQFPDFEGLSDVLKEINRDVSSQYSLSYYPPEKKPGWLRVQVSFAQAQRHCNFRYQERYLMR